MCPGVFTQANAERIENLSVTNFNYSHTVRCTFLSLWCTYVISVTGKLHWKYLFLQDRYADEKAIPPIDEQQDYKLEGFQESDGKTLLKFTRKFDTCDPRDRKLEVCVLFLRNTFIGVDWTVVRNPRPDHKALTHFIFVQLTVTAFFLCLTDILCQ